MLESLTTDLREVATVDGLTRGIMAALGLGATTFVEQTAESRFRGLFGTDVGKGSLTGVNMAARVALFLVEILIGMYFMSRGGELEDFGFGVYAGGWWHIFRLALTQTVGTTIFGVTV